MVLLLPIILVQFVYLIIYIDIYIAIHIFYLSFM